MPTDYTPLPDDIRQFDGYVDFEPASGEVCLDGWFTVAQLRRLVEYADSVAIKTKSEG